MMSCTSTIPKLSIVIPVFNGSGVIAGCLDSVLDCLASLPEHGRETVEVILSDNWSEDQTLEIVANHRCSTRVKVIHPPEHIPNRTLHWDFALRKSTAAWMMMLHADDRLLPKAACTILEAIESDVGGAAAVIVGRNRTASVDGRVGDLRPKWPLMALLSGEGLRRYLLPYHCPFHPFTTMSRIAYVRCGGLRSSFELVQDWDLWLRILAQGDALYVPGDYGVWSEHVWNSDYRNLMSREVVEFAANLDLALPGLPQRTMNAAVRKQLIANLYWNGVVTASAEMVLKRKSIAIRLDRGRVQWWLRYYRYLVALKYYLLRATGTLRFFWNKLLISMTSIDNTA